MRSPFAKLLGLIEMAKVFSDWRSIQNFRHRPKDAELLSFRLRALGGDAIQCRPETTDIDVLYNDFFLKGHIPPAGLRPRTIIDLGANIGTAMAYYAASFPDAQIWGVELDEDNFRMATKNVSHIDRCHLIHAAVWTHDGEVHYGGIREYGEWGARIGSFEKAKTAKAITIDTLLGLTGGRCNFMKMDIEGAEREVLKSAESWIHRVGCLKIEIHTPYTLDECCNDLERYGLKVEVLPEPTPAVLARGPSCT